MAALSTRSAAKLLRTMRSRPVLAAAQRRFETGDSRALAESMPAGTTKTPAARPANSPDYGVHIDKATSTFTPVPKRILDGSEEGDALPAAVLSGAPMELQGRTVRYVDACIYTGLRCIVSNVTQGSTVQPNPRLSPANGELTTGAWIGTFSPRDIDGRTL
jgi:hypothetical protein